MNNDINLAEIIASKLFSQLRCLNLIDETKLRNLQICNDYKALRLKNSSPICIQILMEKYSLSDAALNNILFRKNHN